jgi:hypothetical protein
MHELAIAAKATSEAINEMVRATIALAKALALTDRELLAWRMVLAGWNTLDALAYVDGVPSEVCWLYPTPVPPS